MRATIFVLSTALFLLGASCGGPKPEPKDPKDVVAEGGGTPAPQPKREVSAETKNELQQAAQRFADARKLGLNKSNCGELAKGFSSIYADNPKLPEAKFNEGVVWEECGDTAKAEQIYMELLREHPNFGPAANNVGEIYFKRGNVDGALTYFQRAAEHKSSEGYSNLAVLQRRQGLGGNASAVKEAVDNVHRALAVDSFNVGAYATLATLLYDHAKTESELEMARLVCVQGLKQDESYAPLYNVLGLILLQQGKVTPALQEFKKAVSLNPNFLEAQMNIGAITLNFRDYKTAEESFSTALRLNPDKATKVAALIGLGVAYRGERRFGEAQAKYKEALALDPNNPDIAYNQGILLQDYTFDAGNPVKAIEDLERATNFLQEYVGRGKSPDKVKDAERRIKNIKELIPMLREQQKMQQESGAPAGKS